MSFVVLVCVNSQWFKDSESSENILKMINKRVSGR